MSKEEMGIRNLFLPTSSVPIHGAKRVAHFASCAPVFDAGICPLKQKDHLHDCLLKITPSNELQNSLDLLLNVQRSATKILYSIAFGGIDYIQLNYTLPVYIYPSTEH